MGKNRISAIDYAKGIAIICVVLGHVLYFCCYNQHEGDSPLFHFIYSFHMPLFFFLSGLVVSVRNRLLKETVADLQLRFKQLVIPMVLIGGVFTIVSKQDLMNIINSDMKSGYWYLLVLFLFYLTVRLCEYLISTIGCSIKHEIIFVFLIVLWLCSLHCVHYLSSFIISYFSLIQYNLYLPYFAVGIICKNHNNIFSNQWVLLCSLLIGFLSNHLQFHYMLQVFCIMSVVVTIMCMCFIFDKYEGIVKTTICYLGRNVLYIYCFHYFIIHIMDFSFAGEWLKDKQNIVLELFVCIIPTGFTILGALIIKQVVTSMPSVFKIIFNRK